MKCPICGGTGKTKNIIGKPLTEQEYMQTCTTEQLADVLLTIYQEGIDDCKQDWWRYTKEYFVDWLKQPHIDKE